MTMIPVITTTDKYDKPTRQQGGRFVVSADKVNGQLDKMYFFNLDDQKYYRIDESTASTDYIAQARKYEESLASYRKEQERAKAKAALAADTTDSTQINSFADVFAKSIATTNNPIHATMALIENTGSLINNYTIKPLFEADTAFGEKAGILLNNALTNLGETMDYFTGANYVKAKLQGGTAKEAYAWDARKGRTQYDWNIDTDNWLVDTTANFFLEYVSDPTNWLTFGAGALLNPRAMKDVSGVIAKSAADVGLAINPNQLDNLSNTIVKSVINRGTGFEPAVLQAQLGKVLKIDDAPTLNRMVASLSDNAKVLQNSKDLAILRTVNTVSDDINKTAAAIATRTSVLGYGFDALQLGFKGAGGAANWVLSKLNNAVLKGGDSKKLADLNHVTDVAYDTMDTLAKITDAPKDLPDKVVKRVTESIQKKAVEDLRNRVSANKTNVVKLRDAVNEWAVKQGFNDITDAHVRLANRAVNSRIADGLKIIEQEVFNAINTIMYQGVKDSTSDLVELFAEPARIFDMTTKDVSKLDSLLQNDTVLKALPAGTFDMEAYNAVKELISAQTAMHYMNDLYTKLDNIELVQVFKDLTVNSGAVDVDALLNMQINLKQVTELIKEIKSDPALTKWLSDDIKEWFNKVDYTNIYKDVTRITMDHIRPTQYLPLYSYKSTLADLIRKMVETNVLYQSKLAEWYATPSKMFAENIQHINTFTNDLKTALSMAEKMLTKQELITPVKFGAVGKALKGSLSNSVMTSLKKVTDADSVAKAFISNDVASERIRIQRNISDENVRHLRNKIIKAVKENTETKDFDSLITKAGLVDAMNTWAAEGVSADLIGYIRRLVAPKEATIYSGAKALLPDDVYNALENLYEALMDEAYADTPLTASQLKSHLDVAKLTQASSLSYILSTPVLTETLSDIYANQGVGMLVDMCSTFGEDSLASSSAKVLKSLAHSTYNANKMLNMIEKADIDQLWKGGLRDTLAGIMRMHIDEISNVDTMTDYLLNKAKQFVDNSNSNRVDLNPLIDNAKAPAYRVMQVKHNLQYNTQPSWKMIANKLSPKDGENTYDIVYSIGQTGVSKGTVYEFSYAMPDGTVTRLVDKNVLAYESMLRDSAEHTFEVYGTTPSKLKKLLNRQEAIVNKSVNTVTFDTSEEFMAAVFEVFANAKTVSRKAKASVRMIGFDNAGESLNSDKILNKFLTGNALNARLSKEYSTVFGNVNSVDVAQLMRIENYGAAAITDDVRAVVTNIVAEAKKYMDETNMYAESNNTVRTYLMPDFNNEVLDSVNSLIQVVDTAIVNAKKPLHEIIGADVEELRALSVFSLDDLAEMKGKLSSLRLDIIDSLKTIGAANEDGAKNIIVRKAFNELSGEPNIMKFIQNNLSNDSAISDVGIKRLYRPRLFDDWYGINKFINQENKELANITMRTAFKYSEVATRLQKIVDNVRQPALILDMYYQDLWQVTDILKAYSDTLRTASRATFIEAYSNMKALNKVQMYAVTQQMLYYAKANATDPKFVEQLYDMLSEKFNPHFAACIVYPEASVMFDGKLTNYVTSDAKLITTDGKLYTPGVPTLFSPLVKADNILFEFDKQIKEVDKAKATGDTLAESLIAEDRLREFTGFNAPHMRIKEAVITKYTRFIDTVKLAYQRVYDKIYSTEATDALDALSKRKQYTADIESINAALDDIKVYHATNRAATLLDMNLADYTKYLYKYSQGIQAFDLDATVFNKELSDKLLTFVNTIKNNPNTGLKYYVNKANPRWMYVYIDNTSTAVLTELEKGVGRIPYTKAYNAPISEFAEAYEDLTRHMDEVVDEAYSLSMQRSMNSTAFEKEFLAVAPDEVKNGMLSLDYLYEHDMLSGFNHTVVGDYDSGIGDMYKTYSNNLVSNVASGINSYINNIRGKDMYTALITSPEYSLQKRMELIEQKTGVKVTAKDVHDALKDTGYVVIGFKDDRIVEYVINSASALKEAITGKAILIDYASYDRMQLMFNDNRVHGLWYKLISTPLLFLKLGMLGTPGWLLRNIPDSFLKGMIGQNAGADYLSTIPHTVRNIQVYDRVRADIFKTYKGKVNTQTIHEYFKDAGIPKLMDEQLFRKMHTFYSSSSAVPTAAQLSAYKDVADKLFTYVKDDGLVNKTDVNMLLKSFVDNNGSYSNTKKALASLLDEDKVDVLMNLFQSIPKNYGNDNTMSKISDVLNKVLDMNPFMKGSNYIETLARTHAFLYASEYTPGTISKGMRVVDATQFNRAHDTAGKKLLETLLPFSSFQIDNTLFWMEALTKSRGSILSAMNDYMQARYNEEELDSQDIVDGVALRYLFLNGNAIIDESTGLTLKVGDSFSGALQLMADPIGGIAGMVNVPVEVVKTVLDAINADPKAYKEDSFNNPKPISEWGPVDYVENVGTLVPFFGSMAIRFISGYEKMGVCDSVLPMIMPSVFSAVKTDEAGTTYASRPIGVDWYTNVAKDPTYNKTHRFVFGISYVPTWLLKDRMTYVNTRQRLIDLGVTEEIATAMVTEWGFYMKAPEYVLRRFNPNAYKDKEDRPKKYYPKRVSKVYPKNTKARRIYAERPRVIKMRDSITGNDYDTLNSRGKRVFRSYRVNNFKRRFVTMNGHTISRDLIIKYRGYNASSERTFREHSRFRRQRLQRYSNNYTKIRL